MRLVHCLLFLVILSGTIGSFAAQSSRPVVVVQEPAVTLQSQETFNALQLQRIQQVEKATVDNTTNIAALTKEIEALRSSVDRFVGMGIGIGSTLTMLQALLVILTFRNGSSKKAHD